MAILMEKCAPFNTENRDRYYEMMVMECQRRVGDGVTCYLKGGGGSVEGVKDFLIGFLSDIVPVKTHQVCIRGLG